ncbi:MAG: hypothetical protein Q4G16_02990 [Cruoricaptor ignavus]|nr:hypothetical protein [Cruoricaptor ignavus]
MKKIAILLCLALSHIFYAQSGRVGIGTNNPRGTLEVAGNILLDGYIIISETEKAEGDYHLLVRSTESTPAGEVKRLDIDLRNVGPINKYTVKASNVKQMQVLELNTNLDADKYYLGLAEAVFSGAVVMSNGKVDNNPIHGTYYTSVSKKNDGKYKISLNFNNAVTQNDANGNWELSFVVFEKVLVKDWGEVSGSVSKANNFTGSSTETPVGLQ